MIHLSKLWMFFEVGRRGKGHDRSKRVTRTCWTTAFKLCLDACTHAPSVWLWTKLRICTAQPKSNPSRMARRHASICEFRWTNSRQGDSFNIAGRLYLSSSSSKSLKLLPYIPRIPSRSHSLVCVASFSSSLLSKGTREHIWLQSVNRVGPRRHHFFCTPYHKVDRKSSTKYDQPQKLLFP